MTVLSAHRDPACRPTQRAERLAAVALWSGRVSRAEVEACLSRPEDRFQSVAPERAAALPEAA